MRANQFSDIFVSILERECTDEDGDQQNYIVQLVDQRIGQCIIDMIGQFTEEEARAITDSIIEWRDYKCRSEEIPDRIEKHFAEWDKTTGRPGFVKAIDECIEGLKQELNKLFADAVKKSGLEAEQLLTADNKVFLSDTKRFLPKAFEAAVQSVVEYYKEHQIWASFPNKGKGFFSDPRAQFANAEAEVLQEWLQKEIESTVNLYIKLFTEMELDYLDEKRVFMECFKVEALYDLLTLMEKRKKEILGKLVLEEYLEE